MKKPIRQKLTKFDLIFKPIRYFNLGLSTMLLEVKLG